MNYAKVRETLDYNPDTGIVTRKKAHPRIPAGTVVGCVKPDGYLAFGTTKKTYQLHRLIWLWMTGSFPPGPIDHLNGIRSDNRWSNLRCVSNSENQHNLGAARCDNKSSGLLGVHYDKQLKKYRAGIRVNGRQIFLGSHVDPTEAQKIYLAAKDKYRPSHNFHNRSQQHAN